MAIRKIQFVTGKKIKPNKQKGVTIVGVLVGITILSIALVAQIRLLGNTIRRDAELRSLIIATNLAREGIEILFSWRVTEGWSQLMQDKSSGLCADIRLNKTSNINTCLANKFNFGSYVDGDDLFPEFKTYLYGLGSSEYDIPLFWRAMTIKSCEPEDDTSCLILVATTGWEDCSQANWQTCVNSSPDQCSCKLVKLEKKIYNWYVP